MAPLAPLLQVPPVTYRDQCYQVLALPNGAERLVAEPGLNTGGGRL